MSPLTPPPTSRHRKPIYPSPRPPTPRRAHRAPTSSLLWMSRIRAVPLVTARLCQRSSAGWHDLCLIFLRQHAPRPECLLVRHRPHVARPETNCCRSSPISTDPLAVTRTLTNNVSVAGKPANGQNVTSNASADVQAQESNISVTKTANPTAGSPSTNVTFTLDVKNTGSTPLTNVFVSDLLPVGMTYVSSSSGSTNVGRNVSWSDIGPMSPGGKQIAADRSPYRRTRYRYQDSDQ